MNLDLGDNDRVIMMAVMVTMMVMPLIVILVELFIVMVTRISMMALTKEKQK